MQMPASRRRAFIAAPLIGAIVFLTAIVFVVNINKAEANAVQQASLEAYHNRINAVVELYRADAGSLFRESMKNVIEDALTSQCWSSLFTVRVDASGTATREAKLTAVKQARKDTCEHIKQTVHNIVCSNTGLDADRICTDACLAETGAARETCLQACSRGQRTYGLQRWLGILNEEFSFEGIELSPSNRNSFQEFFKPTNNGEFDYQRYLGNCKALIPELAIDCSAFAEGDLQCCKSDTINNRCPASDVIPGCESGIFYVKVKPSDPRVYASLPRVQAKDDAGNYVRAGAVSDSGEFFLPISFPLFRYLDKSFQVYSGLAFGENVGEREAGASEGILDGACYAGNLCSAVELRSGVGMKQAGLITRRSSDDARVELAGNYYSGIFIPALERSLTGENLDVEFLTGGGANTIGKCTYSRGGFTCDADAESHFKELLRRNAQAIQSEDRSQFSPYLPELQFLSNFVDRNPRFRVKQNKDNEFCWYADLRYNS